MSVMWRRLKYSLTPQFTIYKNLAPLLKDKFVLEVGYCTGAGVMQYVSNAKRVIGIDTDGDAVEFAREAFPLSNVEWEYGDICGLSIGMYDAVVMIEVIEHIENWDEALQNVYDRLLDKGILIISTPNANGTFIKNELHGDEWTAQEFHDRLAKYFDEVTLHDFSLNNPQPLDTRITPLVAVCVKNSS